MKTWQIDYTVRDGLNEYPGHFFLRAEQLDHAAAAAACADYWCLPEGGCREEFIQELLQEDFAFLPGEERALQDIDWGPAPAITLTLGEDGEVKAVTGIPAGVTVRVEDPEAGSWDEEGSLIPHVSEWAGPL